MFDFVGFQEIILVAVLGLLILGPERLPLALRTLGKWIGKIKRSVASIQREISDELRIEEVRSRALANRKAVMASMKELREEVELMEMGLPAEASESTETRTESAASPHTELIAGKDSKEVQSNLNLEKESAS